MAEPNKDHPMIKDVPIGLTARGSRREFDSMGNVNVPADRYWGAQTQRSLQHFSIGSDHMPKEVYHAYGIVKKACALVNQAAGRLPGWKAEAIVRAADETIAGKLDEHFPLFVWQTGSGTQSNMNVNEVLSNRAIQLLGGKLGSQQPIGPNDDVNMSQSSNDSFPTAMHVAALTVLDDRLIPELNRLARVIETKAGEWMDVVKIGRTHLEDAVPLSVGQEWSGWAGQIRACIADVERSREGLYELALGGTAVGTGLNAPEGFSRQVAAKIAALTSKPFVTAPNKFMAEGSLDAVVRASAAARERAGLLDHAGQSEPDPVRGNGDDRDPGDWRRYRSGVRGEPGQFRAQRHAAHHHQQLSAFGDHTRRWLREVPPFLGRGYRARPPADQQLRRQLTHASDRPVAADWLSECCPYRREGSS